MRVYVSEVPRGSLSRLDSIPYAEFASMDLLGKTHPCTVDVGVLSLDTWGVCER